MVATLKTYDVLRLLNQGRDVQAETLSSKGPTISGKVLDVDADDGPDVHILISSGELVCVPASECAFRISRETFA